MSAPGSKEIQEYESELLAALEINLSVDLIGAAKRQLSFLRAVHCVPGLHRGPAVLLAIKRMTLYFLFVWLRGEKESGESSTFSVTEL
ncbi:hypothetical protein AXG93_3964s1040 [Marchantia polymorpha subsp. ruderalis]|uniref:Uncharacterized protein n=1 Tax=Marchantia polymorpha subsp. ruderalis TaxID=1480154 RepID=A0A176WCC9_MARPO|nr:hypothetical protein AXG93_3964s1040 [Marchantia polymorpha subsp. ruderalis]